MSAQQGRSQSGETQGQGDTRNDSGQASDANRTAGAGRGGGGRRGNRDRGQRNSRFKGKCDALSGHIYDVGAPNSAQDLFTNTTREIGEHAARECTDAGDFGSGLPTSQLPAIAPPARPDPNDLVALEEFRIDLKLFKEKQH